MRHFLCAFALAISPATTWAWEFTAQFSGEAAQTYEGESRELGSVSGSGPWMSLELFDYQASTNCITSSQMELDVYLGVDGAWEMNGFATLIQPGVGDWRPTAPMAFYVEPRGFDVVEMLAELTSVEVVDLQCLGPESARITLRMTARIEGPRPRTLTLMIQDDAPILNYDRDFGT